MVTRKKRDEIKGVVIYRNMLQDNLVKEALSLSSKGFSKLGKKAQEQKRKGSK